MQLISKGKYIICQEQFKGWKGYLGKGFLRSVEKDPVPERYRVALKQN